MTSAYPDEPGIDPDKWEESPNPDRDNDADDNKGIGEDQYGDERGDAAEA